MRGEIPLDEFFYATKEEIQAMTDLVRQIQDHTRKRRASDHYDDEAAESFAACPAFADHTSIPRMLEVLEQIALRQEEQARTLAQVAEIVTAWSNMKGFVKTISIVSGMVKWAVGFGVAVGLVWAFFKHSVQVK